MSIEEILFAGLSTLVAVVTCAVRIIMQQADDAREKMNRLMANPPKPEGFAMVRPGAIVPFGTKSIGARRCPYCSCETAESRCGSCGAPVR